MTGFLKHIILFFLLHSALLSAKAQSPANYKNIDEFVKNFPIKPTTTGDIKMMAREIKRQFHTEDELARAAFFWIAHNISYDCDGYRQKNGLHELDDVLKQHKGICAGYASLMKFFCDELGVECVIVRGFAIGISVKGITADNLATNHAWNAVKIKGEWKLIDVTWGSGSANDDCTKTYPEFKEYYFYTKPEDLITNHFPDSAHWQLLKTPMTAEQFATAANKVKEEAKKNETLATFAEDEPKDSVIKRNIGETVRFLFEKKDMRNMVSLSVYDSKDSSVDDRFDSIKISGNKYYYDYKVQKAGYYRVDVSIFYYTGTEEETVGTNVETYYLQVPARKSAPIIKKPTVTRGASKN